MAIYEYQCDACGHLFERTLKIADRNTPLNEECPSCSEQGTVKMNITAGMYVDNHKLMGKDRKLDGGFKEVMSKIHERTPGSNLNDMVGYRL